MRISVMFLNGKYKFEEAYWFAGTFIFAKFAILLSVLPYVLCGRNVLKRARNKSNLNSFSGVYSNRYYQ